MPLQTNHTTARWAKFPDLGASMKCFDLKLRLENLPPLSPLHIGITEATKTKSFSDVLHYLKQISMECPEMTQEVIGDKAFKIINDINV